MTPIAAPAADRAHDRVLDAVGEERPVGEVRDRVVEGLVRELVLERLALADVAAVQDDAADVLVLEQVRVLDLELEPGPVAMPERALDHVRLGAAADVRLADAGDDLREPRPIRLPQQAGEVRPFDLVRAVAEDALDRRALVRDGAVGVEHGDEVARVGDERAEARLALAAVEVLGERRSLDGERDLRGERLERVDELARDPTGEQRTSRPRAASRRCSGRKSTAYPPSRRSSVANVLGQPRERRAAASPFPTCAANRWADFVSGHSPSALDEAATDAPSRVQRDEADVRGGSRPAPERPRSRPR